MDLKLTLDPDFLVDGTNYRPLEYQRGEDRYPLSLLYLTNRGGIYMPSTIDRYGEVTSIRLNENDPRMRLKLSSRRNTEAPIIIEGALDDLKRNPIKNIDLGAFHLSTEGGWGGRIGDEVYLKYKDINIAVFGEGTIWFWASSNVRAVFDLNTRLSAKIYTIRGGIRK